MNKKLFRQHCDSLEEILSAVIEVQDIDEVKNRYNNLDVPVVPFIISINIIKKPLRNTLLPKEWGDNDYIVLASSSWGNDERPFVLGYTNFCD